MKIFYVIKNPINNLYLSQIGNWVYFEDCYEFYSEEEAIDLIGRLDGYFIVEKVYQTFKQQEQ